MPQSSPDKGHNGNPTAAEIFRVFRNTIMASIEGLKLLLEECADLRADLVTINGRRDSDGKAFSVRQQNRILELKEAALEMEVVLASLPSGD